MEFNKEKSIATMSVEESNRILRNINAINPNRKNHLTYAASILSELIGSKLKKYNRDVEKLQAEYCSKDEKGDFKLNAQGGYIIPPGKVVELGNKIEKLAEDTTIQISLYKCKDQTLIEELPMPIIIALNGVLFDYDLSKYETNQVSLGSSKAKSNVN